MKKYQSLKDVLGSLPPIKKFKNVESAIAETLNSLVKIKGKGTLLMKELFTPSLHAAVVVRCRNTGLCHDVCDYGRPGYQLRYR